MYERMHPQLAPVVKESIHSLEPHFVSEIVSKSHGHSEIIMVILYI